MDIYTESQIQMHPGLFLKIEKARQMDRVPVHSHEFIEIAFVAGGSALHCHTDLNGRTQTNCLIQGDVFSVQIGERHGYEQCGNMVLYNIFLKKTFIDTYQKLNALPGWSLFFGDRSHVPETVVHLSAATRHWAAQCLDRAVAECKFTPPGYDTVMTALVVEFLVTAMRAIEINRIEHCESYMNILSSINIMEENPDRRFTLKELARVSKMSVPSYTKKFRASTGVSPMGYLQKLRLSQVCHYLSTTDLSIENIAGRSGFCTSNYLIKIFRREYGITPAQYRKKQCLDA